MYSANASQQLKKRMYGGELQEHISFLAQDMQASESSGRNRSSSRDNNMPTFAMQNVAGTSCFLSPTCSTIYFLNLKEKRKFAWPDIRIARLSIKMQEFILVDRLRKCDIFNSQSKKVLGWHHMAWFSKMFEILVWYLIKNIWIMSLLKYMSKF